MTESRFQQYGTYVERAHVFLDADNNTVRVLDDAGKRHTVEGVHIDPAQPVVVHMDKRRGSDQWVVNDE